MRGARATRPPARPSIPAGPRQEVRSIGAGSATRPRKSHVQNVQLARQLAIVEECRSTDLSFLEVGKKFGISGERVRQIVVDWEATSGETLERTSHRRSRRKQELRREQAAARAERQRIGVPTVLQRLATRIRLVPAAEVVPGDRPAASAGAANHPQAEDTRCSRCWEWTGRFRRYALFRADGEVYASRLAYRLFIGPIPPSHLLLLVCPNERCINPWHHEPTPKSAAVRLWTAGITRPRVTHCKYGHEYTEANSIPSRYSVVVDGHPEVRVGRTCRQCGRDRHKRQAPRRRQKQPPLPKDQHERDLEKAVRRILRRRVADRAQRLAYELECYSGFTEAEPALDNEGWEDYSLRTNRCWGEWFCARLTATPRVQKSIQRASHHANPK